jgi:hypothetical protein
VTSADQASSLPQNHDKDINPCLGGISFKTNPLAPQRLAKSSLVIKIAYLLSTLTREYWLLRRSIALAV